VTAIIICGFEGVLRSPAGNPVTAGCRLYRTLRSALAYQVIVLSETAEPEGRSFFAQQHMPAPVLLSGSIPADPESWVKTCRLIRRYYPYTVDFTVVADPAVAAALYHDGFRALLWTDPRYARPEWRPDAAAETAGWAQLARILAEDQEIAPGPGR
jgi:hypothetical protein